MKYLVPFLIFVMVQSSCQSGQGGNGSSDSSTRGTTKPDDSKWTYDVDVDQMTNKKMYEASLSSEDRLFMGFQNTFQHPSFPLLFISCQAGQNGVMFSFKSLSPYRLYDGAVSDTGDGPIIKAKFDDGEPISFDCTRSSSRSSIFVTAADSMLSKIKTAKKMLLQVTFDNEGRKLMTFDVHGLKWDHGPVLSKPAKKHRKKRRLAESIQRRAAPQLLTVPHFA